MRLFIWPLAAILVGGAGAAFAQGAAPADPRLTRCVLRVKGMERAVERNDLTYRTAADSVRGFDLFLPPRVSGKVPLVVFFNAGSGNNPPQRKWGIYRDWARLVTTRGMAAMLPDAASGQATGDMGAALDHVRANAARYGIDPDRVALWGCSMHVREGLPVGMDPARRIRAVVMYYGVTDTAAMDPDKPVLLARAGLDSPGINQAMGAWATRAVRLGAPLTWIDLPTLHHAFDAFEDNALSRSVVATTLDFFERELSPEGIRDRAAHERERTFQRRARERDWPEALRVAEAWNAEEPESGAAAAGFAQACYETGDHARAALQYERAGDLGTQRGNSWYNAACCHALLGDKERALALLEKVSGVFRGDRSGWERDPDLASIRQDPRFRDLMAK